MTRANPRDQVLVVPCDSRGCQPAEVPGWVGPVGLTPQWITARQPVPTLPRYLTRGSWGGWLPSRLVPVRSTGGEVLRKALKRSPS